MRVARRDQVFSYPNMLISFCMQMVEEGIGIMHDLGALSCLRSPPGAPFGTFDPAVWEAFGAWLIRAQVLRSLRAEAEAGHHRRGGGSDTETIVMALCRDGGGLWTNKFRTPQD